MHAHALACSGRQHERRQSGHTAVCSSVPCKWLPWSVQRRVCRDVCVQRRVAAMECGCHGVCRGTCVQSQESTVQGAVWCVEPERQGTVHDQESDGMWRARGAA